MKKVLLVLVSLLFLTLNQAYAYRLNSFSDDAKIISAMRLLEQSGDTDVFRNLQKYGMKVKFSDLSMVSVGSNKAFAVSTYNQFGTRVILINSQYKNAPAEQIACLIAHESYHTGYSADLEEETLATQKEAACWSRLKIASKTYPDNRLTRRLDKLSGLYLASDSSNNLVEQKIADSSFYRTQFGLN